MYTAEHLRQITANAKIDDQNTYNAWMSRLIEHAGLGMRDFRVRTRIPPGVIQKLREAGFDVRSDAAARTIISW